MAFTPFVPLRVFSSYTLLDGAIDPKAFAKLAKERGFPAIAMTDRNGLYGAMSFASACKDSGIQPIIGTFLGVCRGDGKVVDWLGLYAQDNQGWENLCHLVSRAHLERPLERDPHVTMADLAGYTDGLIALTAGGEGALARLLAEARHDAAEVLCERLEGLFPQRLYIEISRRNDPVEEAAEAALIDLAYARNLPLVATNPANYAEPGFFAAHDAMLCIANSTHVDAAERPRSNREAWVKSAPMMGELFADLPEALANTLVIAQRCAFAPPKRKPLLPSLAGDTEGEAQMLISDARAGLEMRLEPYGDMGEDERKVYFDRLDFETQANCERHQRSGNPEARAFRLGLRHQVVGAEKALGAVKPPRPAKRGHVAFEFFLRKTFQPGRRLRYFQGGQDVAVGIGKKIVSPRQVRSGEGIEDRALVCTLDLLARPLAQGMPDALFVLGPEGGNLLRVGAPRAFRFAGGSRARQDTGYDPCRVVRIRRQRPVRKRSAAHRQNCAHDRNRASAPPPNIRHLGLRVSGFTCGNPTGAGNPVPCASARSHR